MMGGGAMDRQDDTDVAGSREYLESLRAELDRVNLQLLDLLCHRGRLVVRVRDHKRRVGLDLHDPALEARMLDALSAANAGPFDDGVVRDLFRRIFQASLDRMQGQDPEAPHRS